MWEQLARYKNHYLQAELPHLKAVPINAMVLKDMKSFEDERVFCKSPYEPDCRHSTWFNDHAALAYGWYGLPKLMREVCSDKEDVQWRAINSLSEFLQNPLQAQRAITETKTVRIVKNALLRIRKKDNFLFIRHTDRLLKCLILLSKYLNGARQIVRFPYLVMEFYVFIFNDEPHSTNATEILRNCSEKPEILLYLLEETKSYDMLAQIFHEDPCKPSFTIPFWMHLSHFLEMAPENGIEKGLFAILHLRIKNQLSEWFGMCMKCFALILRCKEGQQHFDEVDGIKLLYEILNDRKVTDFEFIVLALQNGLMSKKSVWRCREFTNYPVIISRLAYSTGNTRLQLYCLKALRTMGELPCIKSYMRANCLEILDIEPFRNEINECHRRKLIKWLNTPIYART